MEGEPMATDVGKCGVGTPATGLFHNVRGFNKDDPPDYRQAIKDSIDRGLANALVGMLADGRPRVVSLKPWDERSPVNPWIESEVSRTVEVLLLRRDDASVGEWVCHEGMGYGVSRGTVTLDDGRRFRWCAPGWERIA